MYQCLDCGSTRVIVKEFDLGYGFINKIPLCYYCGSPHVKQISLKKEIVNFFRGG